MTPQNFCAGMIVSWNTQFYLLCVKTGLKLKKSSYRTRCIYVFTAYGAFMCLPHMVHLCVYRTWCIYVFTAYGAFMCFKWIVQQTAIISLHTITLLFFCYRDGACLLCSTKLNLTLHFSGQGVKQVLVIPKSVVAKLWPADPSVAFLFQRGCEVISRSSSIHIMLQHVLLFLPVRFFPLRQPSVIFYANKM